MEELLPEGKLTLERSIKDFSRESWESGKIPADWKLVNIVKKGKKEYPRNYRPVSLTLVLGLERILNKFVGYTKLGGDVDSFESRDALQRDLKLENWAITNHMKFNKGKCWILHLGWDNPGCTSRLENEMLESSATERDLRVLVNGNMSQQCPGSQEGQPCPGGHQAQHCQLVEGEDCPALLCTGAASP
ncbi:rna-directed dna polymerase from mobile element jockey-like [Pitangus sulphuratus]|nr:rna-directed dna polymerase from mobile element jockey-like [Pitangus sulphuratus]